MKYVFGVVGAIVIAILAILIIVLRSGPDDSNKAIQTDGKEIVQLSDAANQGATLVYTIQGELVGDTERRAVRISVNSNERRIEILNGYDETISKSQTFPNSKAGQETFLRALDNAGFARERSYKPNDERGMCPTGNRFIYEVKRSGEQISRLWSTSCSKAQGTMAGSATTIRRLFTSQIPDYSDFVSGTRL